VSPDDPIDEDAMDFSKLPPPKPDRDYARDSPDSVPKGKKQKAAILAAFHLRNWVNHGNGR